MPKTPSTRSKPRSTSRRRPKRTSFLGQLGAVRLMQPLKLRNPQTLLFVAIVAVAGSLAVAFSFAATQSYSLWNDADKPRVAAHSDTQAVELGVKFKSAQSGFITGVKFYKGRANTGTHKGNLWNSNGVLLASATFTNETASKWQTVKFAQPVPVTAGTTYVASYHTTKGRYAADANYFSQQRVAGPLTALAGANGVFRYGTTSAFPTDTYKSTNYWVDVVFTPTTTATPAPTPTPTAVPSASATPTPTPAATPIVSGSCPKATHTPGGPDSYGGCWPYAGNTGIPAGTVLSAYTGSCTVTTANLAITAKTVNCDPLVIRAGGVKIANTKINGSVLVETPNLGYSFTITDSEVDAGAIAPGDTDDNSAIGKSNFTATRVNTHGGKRGIWCEYACTVQDSWIHDQAPDPSGVAHESGIRMGDGATIKHNSILCNAPDFPPDAGCSANLTGYGDFAPIRNNTIFRNLFVATTGGACAYGGASGDDGSKPYGKQSANIVFQDNIFQRGTGGKCGYYFPITDFDSTRPGNQWLNNRWDSGATLPPAN